MPDESTSSWVVRQQGRVLVDPAAFNPDFDFGRLRLVGAWPSGLATQLGAATLEPDPWLLDSQQRGLYCPRCWADDWAQGRPPYLRRAWMVSWRTVCPLHGQLSDHLPAWSDPRPLRPPRLWTGAEAGLFVQTRGTPPRLAFSIGDDHRAVHLESALGARVPRDVAWFPRGHTVPSLRCAYRDVVKTIVRQFRLYPESNGPAQTPLGGFPCLTPANRYAINVIAEALVSLWTDTPLPDTAHALRTELIVRAAGWALPDGASALGSHRSNCQSLVPRRYWRQCSETLLGRLRPETHFCQPEALEQLTFTAREAALLLPPALGAWVEQRMANPVMNCPRRWPVPLWTGPGDDL